MISYNDSRKPLHTVNGSEKCLQIFPSYSQSRVVTRFLWTSAGVLVITPSEYPRGLTFCPGPSLLMPTKWRPPEEPGMLQGPCSSPLLPEGVAGRTLCGGGSMVLGRPCDPGYHADRARSLVTSLDTAGLLWSLAAAFSRYRETTIESVALYRSYILISGFISSLVFPIFSYSSIFFPPKRTSQPKTLNK